MTFLHKNRSSAFTLIEIVVAVVCLALLIGVPTTIVGSIVHSTQHQGLEMQSTLALDSLTSKFSTSAQTSASVYTPNIATCATAPSNPSADGVSCNSVRFYGIDTSGNPHFWGWDYNANAKTLTACKAYTSPDATCSAAQQANPITGITNFSATPTTATALASAMGLSSSSVSSVEHVMYGGYSRIVAGNRVMQVQMSNGTTQREADLLQGGAPFSASVVDGAIQAPGMGASPTIVSGANPIRFYYPSAPSSYVMLGLLGYENYAQYTSTPWSVSACNPIGSSSGTIANVSPSSPSELTYGSYGAADIMVSPTATAGTCAFSYTASPNNPIPGVSAGSTNVYVMSNIYETDGSNVSGASVLFASPSDTTSTSFYVNKNYDDLVINPQIFADTDENSKSCVGSGSAEPRIATSIGVQFVPHSNQIPGSYTGTHSYTQIGISPIASGTCYFDVRSGYPYDYAALQIKTQTMGYLSFNANSDPTATTVNLTFNTPTSASQTVKTYKTLDLSAYTLSFLSNGCSSTAGFYPQTGTAGYQGWGTSVPSETDVRVTPANAGYCTAVLQDNYGGLDHTLTFNITVDPSPNVLPTSPPQPTNPPAPTPPPATPAPQNFAGSYNQECDARGQGYDYDCSIEGTPFHDVSEVSPGSFTLTTPPTSPSTAIYYAINVNDNGVGSSAPPDFSICDSNYNCEDFTISSNPMYNNTNYMTGSFFNPNWTGLSYYIVETETLQPGNNTSCPPNAQCGPYASSSDAGIYSIYLQQGSPPAY